MAQQHGEHLCNVGHVVNNQSSFAGAGLNSRCLSIGRQLNGLVRLIRQNLAETIKRGLNNSSSAGSATILHPVSLSAGFVVESEINVAQTSMRVYKTSCIKRIKIIDKNIVDSESLFCYGEPKSDQPKEQGDGRQKGKQEV